MAKEFDTDTFYIWMTRLGNGPWKPVFYLGIVTADPSKNEYCVRGHNERGRRKRPREEHAIFRFSTSGLKKVYPAPEEEAAK